MSVQLLNRLFGPIQTSDTGGEPYSYTVPYVVSEYSLQVFKLISNLVVRYSQRINNLLLCVYHIHVVVVVPNKRFLVAID